MDEAVAAPNRGGIEASLAFQASDAHVLAPLCPAEVDSAAIRAALASWFREYSVASPARWKRWRCTAGGLSRGDLTGLS